MMKSYFKLYNYCIFDSVFSFMEKICDFFSHCKLLKIKNGNT